MVTPDQLDNEPTLLATKRLELGQALRQRRQDSGMSEEHVVHSTRIAPPFIKALEEGDFEKLPGKVFGRGFIKNICKILRCDPEEYLQAFDACWEEDASKEKKVPGQKYLPKERQRRSWWVYALLLFVVSSGAGAAYYFWVGEKTQELSQQVAVPSPAPAPSQPVVLVKKEVTKIVPPAVVEKKEEKVKKDVIPGSLARLELEVVEEVKVRFRLNSEEYKSRAYLPGKYVFSFAESADFYIKELEKVKLTYNGKPLASALQRGPHLHFSNKDLRGPDLATQVQNTGRR